MDRLGGAESAQAIDDLLAALDDESTQRDCGTLIDLMQTISGVEPQVWSERIIGFGSYHYRYESGREGDCHLLGFAARPRKITVYLMDGTARHAAQLARLGKHSTGRVCVYISRLEAVDLEVLESVLRDSFAYLAEHDGSMHRVAHSV